MLPLGVLWVVERTMSWLLQSKQLGLRRDRAETTTLPLLTPGCVALNADG